MQNEVIQAAVQVETSKLLIVMLLLTLPQVVGMAFLFVRSRSKIAEQTTVAQLDERAKREAADLDERKRFNDSFNSVIELLQKQHESLRDSSKREAERQQTNDAFQKSYLEVAQTRTEQLNGMLKSYNEQRVAVQQIEAEVKGHREASTPAIEIVKELPTTLQRIEESLKRLDEQLKAIPSTLKNEIAPLMQTVKDLKTEVQELTDEAKRVTETILPLITPEQPPIIEALGAAVVDPTKTPPPGTLKAVTPPFTDDAQVDVNGVIKGSGTVPSAEVKQ